MAPVTHQPAPSDTQGNASRQLAVAVVVVFGRRVAPARGALTKFDISDNSILAEGGKALAEALKGNQVITELSAAGNRLAQKVSGGRYFTDRSVCYRPCRCHPRYEGVDVAESLIE
jgi:hypothetical protein